MGNSRVADWAFRIAFTSMLASLLGCAHPSLESVIKTNDVETLLGIKVVALAPVQVPSHLPNAQRAQKEFSALLEDELRKAGYTVVDSGPYEEALAVAVREKGPAFDPATGRKNEETYDAVQGACLAELRRAANVDGILYAAVEPVSVPFNGCDVTWDGITEEIAGSKLLSVWCATSGAHGRIPAISLVVLIRGDNGKKVYLSAGGIQLATRFDRRVFQSEFIPIRTEELLTDAARNRAAVRVALSSLKSNH